MFFHKVLQFPLPYDCIAGFKVYRDSPDWDWTVAAFKINYSFEG
jgi:hypothetical protein